MGVHRDPDGVPSQYDDAVNRLGRRPRSGRVALEVAERLPGLELLHLDAPVAVTRKSPRWALERLRYLSTAVRGTSVLHAHRNEAPAAYRQLYRDIGRDPDEDPPPLERAYRERLTRGGFPRAGLPADALTIVLAETGIPIWCADAELLEGPLGIRRSLPGEIPVPRGLDPELTAGQLVVADDLGVVAELCRDVRPLRAVGRDSRHAVLFSVRPGPVSDLRVHEAFWSCLELLS